MARRRMFSPDVICTDKFNEMPVSAQNLYVQLGMNTDDDGFVSPKRIVRQINANEDDLKILIAKGYLIPFPSGVVAIRHFRVNNLVRKDWYKQTLYQEEKKELVLDRGNVMYLKSLVNELVNEPVTITNKLINKKEGENGAKNRGNYEVKKENDKIITSEIKKETNNLFNINKK
jgi:hypothetical protein